MAKIKNHKRGIAILIGIVVIAAISLNLVKIQDIIPGHIINHESMN